MKNKKEELNNEEENSEKTNLLNQNLQSENNNLEIEHLEKKSLNLKDLSEDRILNSEISGDMKRAYIDYAMSVIVSRALPSVEDGLKPVHRRILYAMKLMGLEKGMTKKCARIVGDTMGKFHPHGDLAIYNALVRMAQDFSLRYPLIKGQGNFGSLDGDNPAASRYTEAKLTKISNEILEDIDKKTVKFIPNFDNSLKEPIILPGKIPNLLINGSSGIAVGMTTNIPSHNLIEVCEAIIKMIDNPQISITELMEIIKGPDFPTGGIIISKNLKELYENGKASFIVRGKVDTEVKKNKINIVINEIPYQVNKSVLVKQIAELVKSRKLIDVSDIRDESSKGKVRIVIELKKGTNFQFTINRLYKFTKLQDRFDAVFVALVSGVPKLLSLKEILFCYINFRKKIITNRIKFDLEKAEIREHIVKGLLICLNNLDEIIRIIKNSKNPSLELTQKFNLSKKQVEAILEIKLRQLTSLEHEKLKKEENNLKESILKLKKILDNEKEIYNIIKKELKEIKEKYGDNRRSKIIKSIKEIKEKDLVQKKDVIISISDKGYIKRMAFKAYHEQKRGGKGVIGAELTSDDFIKQVICCSTHDYLLLFSAKGKVFWLKAYKVREAQRYGRGQAIVNLLNIKEDKITKIMSIKEFKDNLFIATKKGHVKKIKLESFSKPRMGGVRIIKFPLTTLDSVVDVETIKESQEIMLLTKKGLAIKFNSDKIRLMGRASYGVTGIKLGKDDEVVSLRIIQNPNLSILTVTEKGYGKRSLIKDYRLTGRACKGVINLKITEKTGNVVNSIEMDNENTFIVSTKKGIIIRTSVKQIRIMGRVTQGVRIIRLRKGDKVCDIAKLIEDKDLKSLGE